MVRATMYTCLKHVSFVYNTLSNITIPKLTIIIIIIIIKFNQ